MLEPLARCLLIDRPQLRKQKQCGQSTFPHAGPDYFTPLKKVLHCFCSR
uniref:Uncharacterized protein n=1 Tax=Anguilla anguilla TaxID=7936 RepID=A0A0E9QGB7_ANGAN